MSFLVSLVFSELVVPFSVLIVPQTYLERHITEAMNSIFKIFAQDIRFLIAETLYRQLSLVAVTGA